MIRILSTDDDFTSPECVLCEQLVKEVEKKVKNDKSRVCFIIQNAEKINKLTLFLHLIRNISKRCWSKHVQNSRKKN